jgi:hypothetical protein
VDVRSLDQGNHASPDSVRGCRAESRKAGEGGPATKVRRQRCELRLGKSKIVLVLEIISAELTSPFCVLSLFAQRHALCPEFTFGDFYCRWQGGAAVPPQKI